MTIKPMGKVISIERIKQGLSMAALAKKAKISAATVYNLENRRGSVSPTTAKRFVKQWTNLLKNYLKLNRR